MARKDAEAAPARRAGKTDPDQISLQMGIPNALSSIFWAAEGGAITVEEALRLAEEELEFLQELNRAKR